MNLFKTLFIAIFTLFVVNAFAQDETNGLVPQVNLTILAPGVSGELPLSSNFSAVGKIALGFAFQASVTNGQSNFDFLVAPIYTLQGRYYYNGLKSETKKGKSLFVNSGNYAFAQFAGNLDALSTSVSGAGASSYSFGAGWGLQRIYKNKVIVSWGIGVGYYSTQQLNLISEFTLGINLYRPK